MRRLALDRQRVWRMNSCECQHIHNKGSLLYGVYVCKEFGSRPCLVSRQQRLCQQSTRENKEVLSLGVCKHQPTAYSTPQHTTAAGCDVTATTAPSASSSNTRHKNKAFRFYKMKIFK